MVTSIAASLGIGSGIDTGKLVSDLAAAQRAGKDALIARRTETNAAKISALGTASGAIDSFATALSSLIAGGSLFSQPTVSNSSILSAKALPGSRLGNFSAEIEVTQLAQAQSMVSTALATAATPVGEGTLSFSVGGGPAIEVVIDGSNNSLSGLAQAINSSGTGITASVVSGVGGAQLVLKGRSGAAQAFTAELTAGDPDALGRFTTASMTQRLPAQDALLKLDGVDVARATNSIADLVPGMQIDLTKAAPGTVVTMGSQRPTEAITQALGDFVAAYNELETILDEATASGASDGTGGGALRGDSAIRDMRRQLSKIPTMALVEGAAGMKTLAEIGVATNRDGSLRLDTNRLQAALAADPDGVEALFNPTQRSDNPLLVIHSAYGKAKPGTYTVTNVTPKVGETPASGMIDGIAATPIGALLRANASSAAAGLVLRPEGAITSATISIDLGLGGALQSIRDGLRGRSGALTTAQATFDKETKSIADAKADLELRSDAYEALLTKNFTAMESRMTAIKATQSYLEQQIALWTKSN
ncbi:flagellar filament capping protein FliD [Sphingomonas sp. 1P06PA]|uniref:flagellar filament capping protein FliD n=1 Tax=Sphingomonas sp. 1P06PA TaxID=554121 RepID=UPI0039A4716A